MRVVPFEALRDTVPMAVAIAAVVALLEGDPG